VYDIKCFHGLAPHFRGAYPGGVAAACRPGGDFLLFATQPSRTRRRFGLPAGVSADEVHDTFSAEFKLISANRQRSVSAVANRQGWQRGMVWNARLRTPTRRAARSPRGRWRATSAMSAPRCARSVTT